MHETTATNSRTLSVDLNPHYLWGRAADPKWKATDKNGHEHRAVQGEGDKVEYPTLERVTEHVDCGNPDCLHGGGYCEGYDATHHECKLCGARVTPGTMEKQFVIYGRAEYRVDGVPVTEEEFERERESISACAAAPVTLEGDDETPELRSAGGRFWAAGREVDHAAYRAAADAVARGLPRTVRVMPDGTHASSDPQVG